MGGRGKGKGVPEEDSCSESSVATEVMSEHSEFNGCEEEWQELEEGGFVADIFSSQKFLEVDELKVFMRKEYGFGIELVKQIYEEERIKEEEIRKLRKSGKSGKTETSAETGETTGETTTEKTTGKKGKQEGKEDSMEEGMDGERSKKGGEKDEEDRGDISMGEKLLGEEEKLVGEGSREGGFVEGGEKEQAGEGWDNWKIDIWDIYSQIKLVNYLRNLGEDFAKELWDDEENRAWNFGVHAEFWYDEKYLVPVLPDDALLFDFGEEDELEECSQENTFGVTAYVPRVQALDAETLAELREE